MRLMRILGIDWDSQPSIDAAHEYAEWATDQARKVARNATILNVGLSLVNVGLIYTQRGWLWLNLLGLFCTAAFAGVCCDLWVRNRFKLRELRRWKWKRVN